MTRHKKRRIKRKKRKLSLKKDIKIPEKIHEIISYLSHSFSSKLLEREDLKQDLYTLYVETLRKSPKAAKNKPGWFFIKFKWYLLTRYKKEVLRIFKEWNYKLDGNPKRSKIQSLIGYLHDVGFFGEE